MIEPYAYKIVERTVSLIDGDDKTIAQEKKKSSDSVDHLNKNQFNFISVKVNIQIIITTSSVDLPTFGFRSELMSCSKRSFQRTELFDQFSSFDQFFRSFERELVNS